MLLPRLPLGFPRGNSFAARSARRERWRNSDPALRRVVVQLKAARLHAGLTQHQVAQRMRTTRSAVCRLERGAYSRPTLSTLENYALVVRRRIEVRLMPWP